MSTFDGVVEEFPCIRIDYFRKNPDRPPPLACFLSHVHSDHLQGLESFRAPFIYCSAATREMLLRIEKYPHRMNFNKGILESRRLHYKHLSKILRPIPLNTPTEIELTPRQSIRVTLLDANHCAGAVMFLIEGDGRAVLYTGDIRSESWWVNSLIRHPVLLPYTLGSRRLDKVYLDTTFATASNIYREFPSKAEGVAELLRSIKSYPQDTIFYFRAWTFGYEDVWMTLSAALNTKVHVDLYQMGVYRSLANAQNGNCNETSSLCGFNLGNNFIPGCISTGEDSRVHSCEPGAPCSMIKSDKTVYIFPIVNRMKDGSEVPEVGAGGGGGDLYQVHELELPDQSTLQALEKFCSERVQDAQALSQIKETLFAAFKSESKTLSLDSCGLKDDYDVPLETLVTMLRRELPNSSGTSGRDESITLGVSGQPLPKTIRFPYSRHSSYSELCELVAALKPKDVFPCTVDPFTWDEDVSMESLFGHLCSGMEFTHDAHMRKAVEDDEHRPKKKARYEEGFSQQSTQPSSGPIDYQPVTSTDLSGEVDIVKPGRDPEPDKPNISDVGQTSGQNTIQRSSSEQVPPAPSITAASQLNEPLQVPQKTREARKAKRNQIREAHHYLKSTPDDPALTIGALPTWSSDEEAEPNEPDHPHQHNQPPGRQENFPNSTTNIDQTSQTLSIGDSAISSQLDGAVPASALDIDIDGHDNDPTPRASSAPSLPPNPIRPRLHRANSSRMRMEAYLAARADTYDAWSSMSLLSTGNNHTEEEIEL